MNSVDKINRKIVRCARCPRLRAYCAQVAQVKKKEFRGWDYWGKPVPGFGDPKAKLWILGLAPAAHGANRTGRMFTGDSSGNWLYRALYEVGWASQPQSQSIDDGMKVNGVYISAAARCAPPDNKPSPEEIGNCAPYLQEEQAALKDVKLFLALGAIGFKAVLGLLEAAGKTPGPRPKFGHANFCKVNGVAVLSSYHPSRQNTQTGTLTWDMWILIFKRAQDILR